MIISLRDLSYEALKEQLSKEDKIVLYSCNACIVACGIGGFSKMDELEDALLSDGYDVIGKDLVSIGCTMNLVRKRRSEVEKRKMYDEATVIIPLICEDGFEAIHEVFSDKKTIRTTKTIGIGSFTPDRGTVLTTPFESTGLEKSIQGYTLDEVAQKTNLKLGSFAEDIVNDKEVVTITVDGKEISAIRGQNLMEVCAANEINIPHFCHHSDLKSYGACRMCVVKIEGIRDLPASCCVDVENGMKIITRDSELEAYRKMILELIMSSGDHNCLTCSKGLPSPFATCELQGLIRSYGITESRFDQLYVKKPTDDTSEVIYYDANKCILCGRCVRVCEEVAGLSNLGFLNRGENTVVAAGLNKQMDQSECVSCMACVSVCPTGALNEKVVYFTGAEWQAVRNFSL